ncbi:AaceriAFL235Wp [[Ashbya] aceris (nom. inval.)]|nr:AaceriAFL235Wp [[Ashbya] aceris (nom. inval.)]
MHFKYHLLRGKLRPILGAILLTIASSVTFLGLISFTELQHSLNPPKLLHRPSGNEQQPYPGSQPLRYLLQETKDSAEPYSLEQRCKVYFESTYLDDPSWSNDALRLSKGMIEDATYTAALMERWRIFADCFIAGDVPLNTVVPEKGDIFEFHQRMYPFLAKVRSWYAIWPSVMDVRTGDKFAPGMFENSRRISIDETVSFWKNWRSFGKGKGIVITAGEEHIQMLPRFLDILDYLHNSLPIELVLLEPLQPTVVQKIRSYLKSNSKQSIRIVDCSKTLDAAYSPLIYDFRHKWLAYIFNTFEEIIFIDLDVVPFVAIDSFFDMKGYKDTGILMFQDREFNGMKSGDCRHAMEFMSPSSAEQVLWGHRARYTQNLVNDIMHNDPGKVGSVTVYNRYMEHNIYHTVESGLAVINKKEKLPSLISSLMLHINVQDCSYGDKEFLWLGQLTAGEDYYIHHLAGGILGVPHEIEDEGERKYEVCSTQIAHMDDDGSIIWINGGVQNCKFPQSADDEVELNPEFLSSKYRNKEDLRKFYEDVIDIQVAFIPTLAGAHWDEISTCNGYTWCAKVKPSLLDDPSPEKLVMKKGDKRAAKYNEIANIWIKAPSLAGV